MATHREFCYRCHKARRTCVCETVSRVNNKTPVLILQHPRERFHALGTVRLLKLGLEQVACRVHFELAKGPSDAKSLLQPGAALLYPGPESKDLSEMTESERPSQLVVLDGTWSHAHALFKANPWVQSLPRVRINRDLPSQYRIRKEPRAECLSTVEAVVEALSFIEPQTQFDGLIEAFTSLIDRQIEETPETKRVPRIRKPKPLSASRAIPAQLWNAEAPVVLYCEATSRRGPSGTERELFYLSALRLGDGAVFAEFVQPERIVPKPQHLEHMGLTPDALERARTAPEVSAAWKAFVGTRVRAAWNQSSLDYLSTLDSAALTVCLKSAYCNYRNGGRGHLEATLAVEGLDSDGEATGVEGRAANRLFRAVEMTRWLVAEAKSKLDN